jgi:hypothetical protein
LDPAWVVSSLQALQPKHHIHLPYACCMTHTSQLSSSDLSSMFCSEYKLWWFSLCNFL